MDKNNNSVDRKAVKYAMETLKESKEVLEKAQEINQNMESKENSVNEYMKKIISEAMDLSKTLGEVQKQRNLLKVEGEKINRDIAKLEKIKLETEAIAIKHEANKDNPMYRMSIEDAKIYKNACKSNDNLAKIMIIALAAQTAAIMTSFFF